MDSLPHLNYHHAQLICFAGKRGQGKTTAIKRYIDTCEPRVFILDPFEDFPEVRRRMDWRFALEEMAEGAPCRRRFVPPLNTGTRDFAQEIFSAIINEDDDTISPLRNSLLVLDEMSLWSNMKETAELQTLTLQGRRMGIRMLVACQRIQFVPSVMLSEATHILSFRTTRPRDLDVLEEWSDGPEVRKIARKLKVGECVVLAL